MHIYIGSDHGGYEYKEQLLGWLHEHGYPTTDCGTYSTESTDYPDFALAVGKAIQDHPRSKGILLCRSGEGMEIAVNKLRGIRAALVWRIDVAKETRHDNDANVLVLPGDFLSPEEVTAITEAFLTTEFSGIERHARRIEKITAIEASQV